MPPLTYSVSSSGSWQSMLGCNALTAYIQCNAIESSPPISASLSLVDIITASQQNPTIKIIVLQQLCQLHHFMLVCCWLYLKINSCKQRKASRQAEIIFSENCISLHFTWDRFVYLYIPLEIDLCETMGWPATKLLCVAFPFLAFAAEQTMGASSYAREYAAHCTEHCSCSLHREDIAPKWPSVAVVALSHSSFTIHDLLSFLHTSQFTKYFVHYFEQREVKWNHWRISCVSNTDTVCPCTNRVCKKFDILELWVSLKATGHPVCKLHSKPLQSWQWLLVLSATK